MKIEHFMSFPVFHKELLPNWCENWVETADPVFNNNGLLKSLPMSPSCAKQVFADWNSRDHGELSAELTGFVMRSQNPIDKSEEDALRGFERKESRVAVADAGNTESIEYRQRMLLLAYAQEESVISLRKLHTQASVQESNLTAFLSDDEEDELPSFNHKSDDAMEFMPSYKFVLKYISGFLRDDISIVVTDQRFAADLMFRYMDRLRPFELPVANIGGMFRSLELSISDLLDEKTKTLSEMTFVMKM